MLTLQYKAKVKDAASGCEEDFNAEVKILKQELQLIISTAMDGAFTREKQVIESWVVHVGLEMIFVAGP
jgi:hypothetical protein